MNERQQINLRVQRLAVANPDTPTPTIEMTLADHEFIDEATQILVASVRVSGNEASMERYQLAALEALQASLNELTRGLKEKLNPDAARAQQRSA